MDILILAPFFPYPLRSGGEVRLYHLMRLLSARHRVSLLALINEEDLEWVSALKGICAQVETIAVKMPQKAGSHMGQRFLRWGPRLGKMLFGMPFDVARFYSPRVAVRLNEMLERRKYDVIHHEYMFMGSYLDRSASFKSRFRTVLGEIDLSFVPLYREFQIRRGLLRAAAYLRYSSMKRYAINAWKEFDLIVTASGTDKEKILDFVPNKEVAVIPNGVDLNYFHPSEAESAERELVFVGSLRYAPNVDAIRYFCKEIFPRINTHYPGVKLSVVGADAPQGLVRELPESVRLTGYLEDIRPCVTSKTVFIVPLRVGGGTRLKILEAMAMGIPVVSTAVGCEGIDAKPGSDYVMANEPQEFAQAIIDLLKDKERRCKIAKNGMDLVRTKYSWEAIGQQLNQAYEAVATR